MLTTHGVPGTLGCEVATATPDTVFLARPYIIGSTRVVPFDIWTATEHGVRLELDVSADWFAIMVRPSFAFDCDELVRFTSDDWIAHDPLLRNRITWTIPFTTDLPIGMVEFRGWRVRNRGTPSEEHDHLWTAPMQVSP